MSAHQVLNVTPFAAAILTAQARDGRDLAVAAVRATFRFTKIKVPETIRGIGRIAFPDLPDVAAEIRV
jgi:hypothetical protein